MVTIADVKAGLTIAAGSTGDDTLIADKIDSAVAYITAASGLSAESSGGLFQEVVNIYNGKLFLLARASDIVIDSITGYDANGSAAAITDYTKISGREYWINEVGQVKAKVEYTSNYIQRALDDLIIEIATYEYLRIPKKTGALNKQGDSVNQTSITYIQPPEFYQQIDRKIDSLVLRY